MARRCWTGSSTSRRQIVAYADDYVLLIMATVPAWLLLLAMRMPRKVVGTVGTVAE